MTAADAERLAAREARRRELDRLPKARLIAMYRAGVIAPDGQAGRYGWSAHPLSSWRKDEVIGSILDISHPLPASPEVP